MTSAHERDSTHDNYNVQKVNICHWLIVEWPVLNEKYIPWDLTRWLWIILHEQFSAEVNVERTRK